MADIELVVKIPKQVYNYIRKYEHIANSDILDIKDTIVDGTPLPKGHGRLIDADALVDSLDASDRDMYCKDVIEEAETIIERSRKRG